ncbi:DUF3736 domain-containing protein Msr-110 isoform X1 [Haemaphysalis longicornis]
MHARSAEVSSPASACPKVRVSGSEAGHSVSWATKAPRRTACGKGKHKVGLFSGRPLASAVQPGWLAARALAYFGRRGGLCAVGCSLHSLQAPHSTQQHRRHGQGPGSRRRRRWHGLPRQRAELSGQGPPAAPGVQASGLGSAQGQRGGGQRPGRHQRRGRSRGRARRAPARPAADAVRMRQHGAAGGRLPGEGRPRPVCGAQCQRHLQASHSVEIAAGPTRWPTAEEKPAGPGELRGGEEEG